MLHAQAVRLLRVQQEPEKFRMAELLTNHACRLEEVEFINEQFEPIQLEILDEELLENGFFVQLEFVPKVPPERFD